MKMRLHWLLFLMAGLFFIWFILHIEAVGGRPLTFIQEADPGIYDPQQTSEHAAYEVFRHVCEPLFYELEGEVWGLLAEDEVEFRDDGREVVVRLRPEIFFHDGTELTPELVQASFERLQRLGSSPLVDDLSEVAIHTDGKFVIFTLPKSNYEFVRLTLTSAYAAIVLPGSKERAFPICTGPYYFAPELYWPDESLILVRYEKYRWSPRYFNNRGMAKIPRLEVLFEGDREKRRELLQEGKGCVLHVAREDAVDHMRFYRATGAVTYLGFNLQRLRWQDVAVRQAMAMAMNKEAMTYAGAYLVAETPLTKGMLGYEPQVAEARHDYDPVRSRAVLREQDFDFADEVVLLSMKESGKEALLDDVMTDLAAVGLTNMRLLEVPRSEILAEQQNFDLLFLDYAGDDYRVLGSLLEPGLLDYGDDDIGSLLSRVQRSADLGERQELIAQVQYTILEKVLWEPLVAEEIIIAVDPRCVVGEFQLARGLLVFHDAEMR